MTLSPGTRLGPYEIAAPIGAGGMGEVYKAKDTRLDRSVAIKVLPAHVSADPERRARFTREAKTIAGLNHQHICTLHDVGEHDGTTYLVMEHLTGETLVQRLEKGPLPLEQALTVATEIADALTAAHRQGVIHRDLKPGNVMLTKSGAKLLDFGLAKLKGHGEQPAAASLASAPTQATPLTAEGAIVGTLQYMAPEQIEGKPADARTDLWALGAMLYEMLTGKRAFEGTSAASLIANIINAEPPALATRQPLTPAGVDRLVRRCLAKQPEERWGTAHDVAEELRWMRETNGLGPVTGAPGVRRRGLRTVLVSETALLLVMAGVVVTWWLSPLPAAPVVHTEVSVRPAEELNAGGVARFHLRTPGGSLTALTWTPDGSALVYVGRRGGLYGVQQLYLRPLDAHEARPLDHTEDAQVPTVSPDGKWVAFWANGAIRKVPLGGGPAIDLAAVATPPKGLVWDARGHLFFGQEKGGIWEIPPDGKPAAVTTLGDGEMAHTLPWPLPGERTLLYTVRKRARTWGGEEIVAHRLNTGERRVLLTDAADARYVPTGHLVVLRRGALWAVAFDADRLEVRGAALPVREDIAQALTAFSGLDVTGAGQFAIAATGTLAWIASPVVENGAAVLVTVDRRGQVSPLPAPVRSYLPAARLSPDGRRLAVSINTLTELGLWVYDIGSRILTPLPVDGEVYWPVWTPDGQRLMFQWLKDGRWSIATLPADGTAAPEILVANREIDLSSVTPDGRQLVGHEAGDIVTVMLGDGAATVRPVLQTPKAREPHVSPDARWLAYTSDVSGQPEIYVRPYPGPGEATQVWSKNMGGLGPAWHPKGRELFFLLNDPRPATFVMMAADFTPGLPPRLGTPRQLFEYNPRVLAILSGLAGTYSVSLDGQRFYAVQLRPPPPPVVTHINLNQNWFEELKAKVPPGR